MAQSPEEITKDMVVALLGRAKEFTSSAAPELGKAIGDVYKAVLQAVRESLTATPEDVIKELRKLKPEQVEKVIKSAHALKGTQKS